MLTYIYTHCTHIPLQNLPFLESNSVTAAGYSYIVEFRVVTWMSGAYPALASYSKQI